MKQPKQDTHFEGQMLQSRKKRQPRYSNKIDPTTKSMIARKNQQMKDDDENGGCCDQATPC